MTRSPRCGLQTPGVPDTLSVGCKIKTIFLTLFALVLQKQWSGNVLVSYKHESGQRHQTVLTVNVFFTIAYSQFKKKKPLLLKNVLNKAVKVLVFKALDL